MDENKSRREQSSQRAQSAADKLRALREKTSQALDDHRRRLGSIENELSQKVKQLADEFDAPAPTPAKSAADYEAEIAALRTQVDEGRQKHEKFVEQLAAARRELEAFESAPCPACDETGRELSTAKAELAKVRQGLADAEQQHAADRTRYEKFAEQLAAAKAAVRELETSIDDRVASLRAELDAAQAETAEARTETASAQAETAAARAEAAAAHAATAEAQTAEQAAGAERDSLATQLEALARDLELLHDQCTAEREDAAAAQDQLAQVLAENEGLAAQLAAALADHQAEEARATGHADEAKQHETTATELRKKLADAATEQAALVKTVDELKAKLADATKDSKSSLDAAEAQRTELAHEKDLLAAAAAEKQVQLETNLAAEQTRGDDLETRLAAAEKLLAEVPTLRKQLAETADQLAEERESVQQATSQVGELGTQLATTAQERDAALDAGKRDQEQIAALRDGLKEAETELARLAEIVKRQPAIEEVQQKFELALADVQKLKRENGALRDDLSQRPESEGDDTQELMALRSERDDLAARVLELENTTAAPADGDVQQQLDELQRRFEMAVDDVRQLKKENAELKEKGAAPGAKAASGGGKGDWAAQKAQLLAMLAEEDDGGTIGVQRKAERATIQETVATTDRALAEKDREIEELRATLAAGNAGSASETNTATTEAVLGADETIAAERKRLAALQSEWEQKLRDAELEFSVMRAKLAREQAALKEKMLEVEISAGQAEFEHTGKQKRGWMDALGLRDEKKT